MMLQDMPALSIFVIAFVLGLLFGMPVGVWIEARAIAKVWGTDWESRIKDES